jgi:hypothetical protein
MSEIARRIKMAKKKPAARSRVKRKKRKKTKSGNGAEE